MEKRLILLDTSVLIDYFRQREKSKTFFYQLTSLHSEFSISTVTEFEILVGANEKQIDFWTSLLKSIRVFNFDSACVKTAIELSQKMKRERKQIGIADLFIAATALGHNLSLATLNNSDFSKVNGLDLILKD